MFGQYLAPMLIFVLIGAASVRWPRVGAALHLSAALFTAWFFGLNHSAPLLFIVTPLSLLTLLYWFGQPEPRRRALTLVAGLPVLIALGCMVEPIWRVSGRVNDGDFGARLVEGNGVKLLWAPAGPGWPLNLDQARETEMMNWSKAKERCLYLNAEGTALSSAPQNIWRLPTVDEAVRSAARHGQNAGGVWDSLKKQARYRIRPDKETPLWNPHSMVIYWWTGTEINERNAWMIVYHGEVFPRDKRFAPPYFTFRCVKPPAQCGNIGKFPPKTPLSNLAQGLIRHSPVGFSNTALVFKLLFMTQDRLEFELADPASTEYWTRMVKCQDACPVHTNACGYVTAIAEGRYEDGFRIARATNPFVSICGRVCGAPCEVNCRRGDLDSPVTIRALKRFVNEQYGPETGNDQLYREACDARMLPPNRGDFERVAVIGAGVSGLTVAHDLTLLGYKVTVFEADAEPGGMLMAGVPIYRLPRDLVKAEINAILALGVELKCKQKLGRDFTIASLRRAGYKAIFLGVGLPKGRKLPLPGSDLPMVYDGLEFLRAFNEGNPYELGQRVVVIGGGNVAYDVARSAVRRARIPMADAESDMERTERIALDVARSALRMSGDKEVHLVCLEQRHEMPADEIEIHEGEEEGVKLHAARGPRAILDDGAGGVAGLRTVKCLSVFDEQGKFNPKFDESVVEDIPADTVLFAIGQTSDLTFLSPEDGVETERGLIKVNPDTYQTTAPDVFACGDIAHGPRLFIHAIASAQIAARSMHDFLRHTRTDVVVRKRWTPADYTMVEGWEQFKRQLPPALEGEARAASLNIVELNFPAAEARQQAARCLRCNINTVFDTSICIACNGCVDVCPENLIKLVGLHQLRHDNQLMQLAADTAGLTREVLDGYSDVELQELGGIMLKDESTCIRCAMCATRCPTNAIQMKRFEFYRECVSVPALNPRIKYNGTASASR
jgi:formate dehydrogenase (NADP+) beta subunit